MSDLPAGWAPCTISEVTGPVAMVASDANGDWEIDYIEISSIDNARNRIVETTRMNLAEAPSRARQIVREGDTLFSTVRPYLRKIAAVPKELDGQIASTGFTVLRPAEGVDPKFLFYKAISRDFVAALTGEQYGVSYPAVKDEQVRSQPLDLPPTNEQRRIVAKIEELFSELDASVESLTRARAQLTTYRQALLKAAFEGKLTADWRRANRHALLSAEELKTRILAERLTSSKSAPASPAGSPSEVETLPGWAWCSLDMACADSLIGLVRASSEQNGDGVGVSYIKMDRLDLDGHVSVEPEVFVAADDAEVARYRLRRGDILFNTRNSVELVGKTGVVRKEPAAPTVFNNNLMRIRTVASIHPDFLAYQMCGNSFRQRLERVKRATTSVAAVYGKDLWPLPVCIPHPIEQTEIVRVLDEKTSLIDALLADIEASAAKIAALRQAILKRAFSGRLVPQDSADEPAATVLARLRERTTAPKDRRTRTKEPA